MIRSIRLLPFAAADAATNMAADEVLLETASTQGWPSLRFYTWTEPTLSLGYFQPAAVKDTLPGVRNLAWVRRASGGAAILHHHELTYGLALPPGPPWQSAESWICRFHHLLQDVLADHGVTARLVRCGEERKLGEVLCFLHQTPGDLTIAGSKVAGSAQRKLRGSLLQHGSLLLRRSEFAPQLPGMCDLAERDLFTPPQLAELLTRSLVAALQTPIEPGDWTAAEVDRLATLRSEKYAHPNWNAKR
jgi:lipoate-protein ligase A